MMHPHRELESAVASPTIATAATPFQNTFSLLLLRLFLPYLQPHACWKAQLRLGAVICFLKLVLISSANGGNRFPHKQHIPCMVTETRYRKHVSPESPPRHGTFFCSSVMWNFPEWRTCFGCAFPGVLLIFFGQLEVKSDINSFYKN